MELIIEIDDDVYKKIVADKYAIYDKMFYSIKNGTPIPDNATNGDVIKAMYPNGTTAKFCTFMRFIDGEHYFNCSEDWWNAPYQKGSEDEKS